MLTQSKGAGYMAVSPVPQTATQPWQMQQQQQRPPAMGVHLHLQGILPTLPFPLACTIKTPTACELRQLPTETKARTASSQMAVNTWRQKKCTAAQHLMQMGFCLSCIRMGHQQCS